MDNHKTIKKVLLLSTRALEELGEFANKRYTNRTSAINLILASIDQIPVTKEMLDYNRSPINRVCVNVDCALWEHLRAKAKNISVELGSYYPMAAILDAAAIQAKNILK